MANLDARSAPVNDSSAVDAARPSIDFFAVAERAPSGILILDTEGRCNFVNGQGGIILGRSVEELIGMHYLQLVAEPDRQALQDLLVATRMNASYELQVSRPDQKRCYVMGTLFELNPTTRMMVITDRTETVRARLEIQAQSQIASRLTYGGSLESIMNELAANVGAATGCGSCAVILCQSPNVPQVVGAWNLAPGFAERHEAAWRAGLPLAAVEVMRPGRALVRADAQLFLERYAAANGLELDLALCPEALIVCLPLKYRQAESCSDMDVVGTLNCFFAPHYAPDERDMRFLQAIADQAAVSMENARLFAEVQSRAAQEAALEERQRLARDLHDSVSQALFGIGLGARTALKLLDANAPAREPVHYVLSLAEAGLAEMRALIFELHPQSLESEGLVAALQKQVLSVGSRHSLDVSNELGPEPPLTPSAREALYRVAQESLNNVVKHAGARSVRISLQSEEETIVLVVTDDGAGFDTVQSFPGHLGLTSMQERMQKVGGHLVVTSAPGQGTSVRAEVPRSRS